MSNPTTFEPVLVRGILAGALVTNATLMLEFGARCSSFHSKLLLLGFAGLYFVLARSYIVAPTTMARVGRRILTGNFLLHIFYVAYWLIVAEIYSIHMALAFPSWTPVILSMLLWRLAVAVQHGTEAEQAAPADNQ